MVTAANFEAVLNGGGVFADKADIEHGGGTFTGDGVENQREFSPNARSHSIGRQLGFSEIDFSSSLWKQIAPRVAVKPAPSFFGSALIQALTFSISQGFTQSTRNPALNFRN